VAGDARRGGGPGGVTTRGASGASGLAAGTRARTAVGPELHLLLP